MHFPPGCLKNRTGISACPVAALPPQCVKPGQPRVGILNRVSCWKHGFNGMKTVRCLMMMPHCVFFQTGEKQPAPSLTEVQAAFTFSGALRHIAFSIRFIRYSRICPLPETKYFVLVNASKPMGPRACIFCVEMPISAPNPNTKPSVKRVDAFT